ncbi:RNA polymerase subunit AC19 [Recurvomyces mirabilis]|nr:RNA polymerase subunit AC19 [Recurvomyces mirabilis]
MAQETVDEPMEDASAGAEANDADFVYEKQRLRVLPGSSDTAASFAFEREDHTLGNALRYMIMKKYTDIKWPARLFTNITQP